MVAMLGRPCAWRTTSSATKACFGAHLVHTREIAGVESTRTPSRSKSKPRHRIFMRSIILATCYSAATWNGGVVQGKHEIESAGDEVWRDVGGRCVLHCARRADCVAGGPCQRGGDRGFRDERRY